MLAYGTNEGMFGRNLVRMSVLTMGCIMEDPRWHKKVGSLFGIL